MKMPMIAILAFGIALGAVLSAAAESEATTDKSELDALRRQVRNLEKRIETLENRLEQPRVEAWEEALEEALRQTSPDDSVVLPRLHGRTVPKNWSRREFNGMPYYVIPLGCDCNQPARPSK